MTIALYSLSASTRADYIAATLPPGALLAAWWILQCPGRWGTSARWLAPLVATVALATFTWYNEVEINAPARGFGDAINRFIEESEAHVRAGPAPLVFLTRPESGSSHLQSYLGSTGKDDVESARRMIEAGQPFWLFGGRRFNRDETVRAALLEGGLNASVRRACRSERLPLTPEWPKRVTLFRVEPADPLRSGD